MKNLFSLLLIPLGLFVNPLHAQMTVAIADFKNNTDSFYLDDWEKSVPEFLKSELSKSEKIVIVERRQLEAVLQEQALSMTGLVDSSTAQQVGTLLGAEYVISGTINQSGKWTRIDAKIIRVSSGHVKGEKVQAPDDNHLTEMVSLLGNNIIVMLSGDGTYIEKETLNTYPTTYFLIASAGLAIGTLVVNNAYNKKQEEYQNAEGLSEFDEAYDGANSLNKARIVLASLTGAAVIGTIYCWIQNMSPDELLAHDNRYKQKIVPNLFFDGKGGIYAALTIRF
jgi:TolB-like protein